MPVYCPSEFLPFFGLEMVTHFNISVHSSQNSPAVDVCQEKETLIASEKEDETLTATEKDETQTATEMPSKDSFGLPPSLSEVFP